MPHQFADQSVPDVASEDEIVYAEFDALGWRLTGVDVEYKRRMLCFGGPLLMACSALCSAIGNRRRRREAERLSAPLWRPLGPLRVAVTLRRLLVWHAGAWWSVWFDSVAGAQLVSADQLDLFFRGDAPYRL
jgi:hypothetical protein